jgi:acyl-CoA reductase-like NAD-dependent aldehyde dehydrogenase
VIAMIIDGRPVIGTRSFDVVNPATGTVFAQSPDCTDEQLDESVTAAARAFPAWSENVESRRAALVAAAELLERRAGEVVALLTAEQGKPLAMARTELDGSVAALRSLAEAGLPHQLIHDGADARVEVVGRPLGVVAAITPWNFPVIIAVNKLAPALLTGNTVVLKPSPLTPLSTLAMAEIINDAFPSGVVNVISGGDALGARLSAHPAVRKITFTGSTPTGKAIAAAAAHDLKRITLELGGNDAAILLDDVDLDAATEQLFWASFINTGQVCAAVKRVYAPTDRYDEVVEALAARARATAVGPGDQPDVELGPLQNERQCERVTELVDDAVRAGARCVAGGSRIAGAGFFFEPTVLAGATDGMRIVDEEQFGPALPVIAYDRLDDAVTAANSTRFGLGGSVWSPDEEQATAIGARLTCGTTWINTHALPLSFAPFGGRDWSGIGVEGGRWGLEGFIDWHTVYTARTGAPVGDLAETVA